MEDNITLVTFSRQVQLAARSWLEARWHAGLDAPAETVADFLAYEAVNDINPFAVHDGDAGGRCAFARKRRAVERQLELAPLLRRRMVHLSNGEIRKTLIARALLRSPALLILDDPFAGMDPASRARLHRIIGELAASGLPMILMVRHADEISPSTTRTTCPPSGTAFSNACKSMSPPVNLSGGGAASRPCCRVGL